MGQKKGKFILEEHIIVFSLSDFALPFSSDFSKPFKAVSVFSPFTDGEAEV